MATKKTTKAALAADNAKEVKTAAPVAPAPAPVAPAPAAPAEKKEAEKKPVEKKPVEKKPIEKKPAEKKPVEKKPVAKAEKPAVKKASAKAEKLVIQFADKEYDYADIIEKCKAAYKGDTKKQIKTIDVYVKPEESKAYYVVNGKAEGAFIEL